VLPPRTFDSRHRTSWEKRQNKGWPATYNHVAHFRIPKRGVNNFAVLGVAGNCGVRGKETSLSTVARRPRRLKIATGLKKESD